MSKEPVNWSKDVTLARLMPEATSRSVAQLHPDSVQSLWLNLPLGPIRRPRIWTRDCNLVEVWVPHHSPGAIQIWMNCAATRSYGIICAQVTAECHIRVCGPTASRVRIDLEGTYCHQVPWGCPGSYQNNIMKICIHITNNELF